MISHTRFEGLLCIFFLLCSSITYSQKGYIVEDGVKSSGVDLVNGNNKTNARFCRINQADSVKTYQPWELSAYGFLKGRRYESWIIDTKYGIDTVFLEKLVSGPTNLYFFAGKKNRIFFLEKDSGDLIPIYRIDRSGEKTGFKKVFSRNLTACEEFSKVIKVANFNRRSLTELVKRYNTCSHKYLPAIKYGLLGAYGYSKLTASSNTSNVYNNEMDFRNFRRLNIGLFIDLPILPTSFSFHSEAYFENVYFQEHYDFNNTFVNLFINCNSLNIPAMLRYSGPLKIVRPIVNSGIMYTWNYKIYNIEKETTYISEETPLYISELIPFQTLETDIYAKNQLSLLAGVGAEFDLWTGSSLAFELRYIYGVNTDIFKFFKNEWKFIVAFAI